MKKGSFLRYRCHTGHAFTAAVLLAEQTKKLEETLWVALRMFEERKNLLKTMAKPNGGFSNRSLGERAKESQVHIERIRSILLSTGKQSLEAATGVSSPNRPRKRGAHIHKGIDEKVANHQRIGKD
jgi:two-component system chemotaxis response regulator CheB